MYSSPNPYTTSLHNFYCWSNTESHLLIVFSWTFSFLSSLHLLLHELIFVNTVHLQSRNRFLLVQILSLETLQKVTWTISGEYRRYPLTWGYHASPKTLSLCKINWLFIQISGLFRSRPFTKGWINTLIFRHLINVTIPWLPKEPSS